MPNILVVDDDPDFVEITRTLLETQNYHVDSASDGEEAINVFVNRKLIHLMAEN